ncbi:hypothetical protein [Nocardioides sp. zg-1228]|uniref:hypothetical protein n=1 Tax=Nocardioides sp. zg-1228 TaxID=2763008 RepID=UPI0016428562|nr:hypothetical protein [Nocardioides sp. zg-1228]MBC2933485.1 hypothetical protein [Nocardioides sp. zg-1228]QSF56377.1 hypothetical protein JX575_11995 [Nocardioides sp. zg-1228]
MSRPEDESRTELAWREIVAHYGERAVLDDQARSSPSADAPPADRVEEPSDDAAGASADDPTVPPSDELSDELPEHLRDVDEVERREQAIARAEQFKPPPAPPFPVPRTWQRGLAWAGVFVSPVVALVIGLFSFYVAPLVGWALVGWFVGGFVYLVLDMPKAPRDPWDDGSRV